MLINMDNMIEHNIALKVMALIGKGIVYIAVAFGFVPAFDFVLLQVDHHVFISPFTKILIEEIKQVLGIFIMIGVLLKIVIGIVKPKTDKK